MVDWEMIGGGNCEVEMGMVVTSGDYGKDIVSCEVVGGGSMGTETAIECFGDGGGVGILVWMVSVGVGDLGGVLPLGDS